MAPELAQFAADLSGDGWVVARLDIPGNWPATAVKQRIRPASNGTRPTPARWCSSVMCRCRIPAKSTPTVTPTTSAHGPATLYGDLNGVWTDVTINNATASDPRNHNIPGDGKFDQSTFPSAIELQVGRIDFANMPAFPQSETGPVAPLFSKRSRLAACQIQRTRTQHMKIILQTIRRICPERLEKLRPARGPRFNAVCRLGTLKTKPYLWAYGCGGGWYQGASGITTTPRLVTDTLHAVFAMTFGDYFGDWDSQDDLLRALLASPGTVLTNAWAGRPNWQFHHMGMGETVGYGALVTKIMSALTLPGMAVSRFISR